MLQFPPSAHPAAQMVDADHVREILASGHVPPSIIEARGMARKAFANHGPNAGALRRVVFFALRHDDSLALVSFGRRLGQRVEWVFGPFQYVRPVAA